MRTPILSSGVHGWPLRSSTAVRRPCAGDARASRSLLLARMLVADRRARRAAASANGHNSGRIQCVHGGTATGCGGGSDRRVASSASTKPVGRGDIKSTRPDERAHEARAAVGSRIRALRAPRRDRAACSSSERVDAQQRSGPVQQVVKVTVPSWLSLELRQQDRVHRPADDGGFDHGAGVQADDRVRVVQRIEVVGLRAGVRRERRRAAASTRRCRGPQRSTPRHSGRALKCGRTRMPQSAATGCAALRAGAAPSEDEGASAGFLRAATNRHTARSGGRPQADAGAEFLARRGGLPAEPVVEDLRARDHDAVGRDTVQLDRFLLLDLVPDEHPLRRELQLAFAGQVVPAGDGEDVADAELDRRARQVELRRLRARRAASVTTTSGRCSRR